jgi:SAM-dependent methyltransferase
VAVSYARSHEATKNKKNVNIHLMDALQPLDLPDDTYDLINLRFTVGVFPRERWIGVLKECHRICKPGGIIRLTEGDNVSVAGAPAFHRMSRALIQVGWAIGKTFSEYEVAVGPMLPKFLQDAGFIDDIRSQTVAIDFSAGAPAHHAVTDDFTMTFQLLGKHMLTFGAMKSEEEFDRTFEEMQGEFQSPDFAGLWYIISFQGRKPL